LNIPGFSVLRWERLWKVEGLPFRDPGDYPASSVATSGTHDTESLAAWWERCSADDRDLIAALPTIRRVAEADLSTARYNPGVRDALIEALFASGSNLLLLPLIDVFGWNHRINEPATIGNDNWTYRLPWPSDRWDEIPMARERQSALRRWAAKHKRA
jgi:4-alpha-glucanotransferase